MLQQLSFVLVNIQSQLTSVPTEINSVDALQTYLDYRFRLESVSPLASHLFALLKLLPLFSRVCNCHCLNVYCRSIRSLLQGMLCCAFALSRMFLNSNLDLDGWQFPTQSQS